MPVGFPPSIIKNPAADVLSRYLLSLEPALRLCLAANYCVSRVAQCATGFEPVRIGSPLMRSTSQGKALTLEARIQSIKCKYKCVAEQENKKCLLEGRIQQRNQRTAQPNNPNRRRSADRSPRSLICIKFVLQLCNNSVLTHLQKSHSYPV